MRYRTWEKLLVALKTIFIREVNDLKSSINIKYKLNRIIITHKKLIIHLSCFCLTAIVFILQFCSTVFVTHYTSVTLFFMPVLCLTTMASLPFSSQLSHFYFVVATLTMRILTNTRRDSLFTILELDDTKFHSLCCVYLHDWPLEL